mgnify:CR=1 FL=1
MSAGEGVIVSTARRCLVTTALAIKRLTRPLLAGDKWRLVFPWLNHPRKFVIAAAIVIAVLLFGMLGVSSLDGIIGRRPSVLFSYALSSVGILMLWALQWYPNFWVLTGFVVCFGSMIGSRGPLLTATAMKIFRGERLGTIYGTISIGSGLGSAFGSWSGGLVHDWTHSYNPVIVFALVAVLLGMIPFLVVLALRR